MNLLKCWILGCIFLSTWPKNVIFDEEEINHILWSRKPRLTVANQQLFRYEAIMTFNNDDDDDNNNNNSSNNNNNKDDDNDEDDKNPIK
jgi:hypothetical protein